MLLEGRIPILLKFALPLILLVLLRVSPSSSPVERDMRTSAGADSSLQGVSESIAALRRVVDREPWRSSLWEQIGRLEMSAGRSEEAIAALKQAQSRDALSPDGLFLLGEASMQQKDEAAAETAWKQMLDLYGPAPRVYERLALLQREQADFKAVVETLRAWKATDPQNARPAYMLGLHLMAVEPDAALPLLLEAAQRDTAYTARVQTLRRGLTQASNAEQPAYGWLMIGRALGSIEQWDLAYEAFMQSVTVSPQYGEAWAFLGEAESHLGRGGRESLERARELSPESTLVNALYSLFLRRSGKPQDALAYLQEVAAREPQEAIWQVEMGNTLVQTGDLLSAHLAYEKAVEIAPKESFYWQALAQFSVQYSFDVRGVGLPAARQAVLLAPNDPAALDAMGWVMANLDDGASAERFLQQALQNDAMYAPASLHLGQVYLKQRNAREAYFYLKLAADLDESGPLGETARRLIQRYFGQGS
jgi:tetratricopeptide (TPR) repeat protein